METAQTMSKLKGKPNERNQEEVKRELQPGVPDNKEVEFKGVMESNKMFLPARDPLNFTTKSN